MTPMRKRLTNVGIGAVALAGVIGWGIPKGADATLTVFNQHFVLSDTFRQFRSDLRHKAIIDSMGNASKLNDLLRIVAGLDSSDRCRRGHTGYCR